MCVPTGKHRRQQLDITDTVPRKNPRKLSTSCDVSEESEKPIPPKLLALEVSGAHYLSKDRYWVLADRVGKVRVKAVTDPPATPVTWTGGTGTKSPIVQEVAIANVAEVPIKATLDCDKSVTIEIYDLVSVSCPLPVKNSKHKAYVSDKTTRLTAVTNPDVKKVWDLLTWTEGAAGTTANQRDVDLKPVGDRTVKVSLGAKSLPIDLHICQWPRLQIEEVTFECHTVLNDGVAEIGVAFDKMWKAGRAAHAINRKTLESQSPVCLTKMTPVKVSATFTVTQKATDDETVAVKADLGFGTVTANVAVAAGADTATMASTQSSAGPPDKVDRDPAWATAWTAVLDDNATWVDAGTSTSPLYVLHGNPIKDIYLTLLDISCESAKGQTSEAAVVAESFKPFTAAKGTGNGFVRRGDGKAMSYYDKGCKTGTGDAVQSTDGLLSNPDATGRCGGWATLLIHMWKMHGITSTKRWYIRAGRTDLMNSDLRFLVKNVTFTGKGSTPTAAYTHDGTPGKNEVTKQPGLPGHGHDHPQFDFCDHVVVKYGGKYYDPSYGVGPYDSDGDYLDAALDALGKYPRHDCTISGVDQYMPQHCVKYADGFAEHTVVLKPFDFYAKQFGKTGAELFNFCNFTPYRARVSQVQPGDLCEVVVGTEVIARDRIPPYVTLANIAAKHSVTEDQVFDHPKNAALKLLRTNKASLQTGDTVIVPSDLDPNCQRVIGHDL